MTLSKDNKVALKFIGVLFVLYVLSVGIGGLDKLFQ